MRIHTFTLASLLSLLALPLQADDAGLGTKLKIHGYLTQAYAETDGNQILGIISEGTTQYRNAALQFRYAITEKDTAVVQLSHSKLGENPASQFRDGLELDWFYYARAWTHTQLKVGRIPIPVGIYNEIRDVGVLLPFYAPPYSVYFEEQYNSEQIDGIVVDHQFVGHNGWELELSAYAGEWQTIEVSGAEDLGFTARIQEIDNRDASGFQVWLNVPIPGLRFGVAAQRAKVSGSVFNFAEKDTRKAYYISVDGDFDKWMIRSEVNLREIPSAPIFPDFELFNYYVQTGYRFTDKVSLFLEYQKGEIRFAPGTEDVPYIQDFGIALHYAFRQNLVLRGEWHDNESAITENPPGPLFGQQDETKYAIISLSVAF